jgi:cytochrome c peroxidase
MLYRYTNLILLLIGVAVVTGGAFMFSKPSDLTPMEELGKELFFDKISSPDWMSCAVCHDPSVGFTGPTAGINQHGAVYRGAVPKRFGNRKPPSAAYATLSPNFHFDAAEGLFIGGNFWDGRATGDRLGNPAADQALGPFLNPVEQNNPSKQAVLEQIADSKYAGLWEDVWGEPVAYGTDAEIENNYNRVGWSIEAYESSSEVNQFSSKWDYYMMGEAELTDEEEMGMDLFFGEAECSACHPPPLFTDFTYDNLGVPRNPENPFYDMDEVYLDDGSPINPLGDEWIDKGLGGFLENHPNADWRAMADENMGKHKVPTLRNVDKRPGNNYPKAYTHNGSFKSLLELVHFYNTRDIQEWPEPEVAENINTDELGNLGLSREEEMALVAFMGTLSDGYVPGKDKVKSQVQKHGRKLGIGVRGPNPFNPSTQIGYELTLDGPVQIDVFSITGQKVATLVNGWQVAGDHEVRFEAGHLPSGTYLVRLTAENRVVTSSVTLLK